MSDPSALTPVPTDRRRWVRHPPPPAALARLQTAAGAAFEPAAVRDLSAGGVGLVVAAPINPGRGVSVELFNAATQFRSLVVADVVYVAALVDSAGWILGCTFDRELSTGELKGLLQGG